MQLSARATVFWALCLVAALLRAVVGLHPYSGMHTPPKFGDYEAQRHWMEITTNLPASDWYRQTSDNNLSYWGLDYPPLSGYQSWLHGRLVGWYEPAAVALHSSRGYESASSKLAMRWTVLLSDVACYFPAALAAAAVFGDGSSLPAQALLFMGLLLSPSLVLIDHGHFQYNCISLGAAAAAAAAVGAGHESLGSALFVLALNHKHMSLYLAPAFFAHLLGRCLRRPTLPAKLGSLARVGLAVIATFAVVWWPFLGSWESVVAVLHRLFPTQRGLYEDYVANFWCASSRLIKWKQLLTQPQLVRACTLATLAALLPSAVTQVVHPSRKGFVLCMANSALAFFLFSYQVHEKSVLLPLLPLTLLTAVDDTRIVTWVQLLAPASMFPLLKKDGLGLAYVGLLAFYWAATVLAPAAAASLEGASTAGRRGRRRQQQHPAAWRTASGSTILPPTHPAAVELVVRHGPKATLAVTAALHLVAAALPSPERYPFLFDAAITTWAFLHFALLFIYTNAQQWREYRRLSSKAKAKQL